MKSDASKTTRFICVLNKILKKQIPKYGNSWQPVVRNPSALSLPTAVRLHKPCDLTRQINKYIFLQYLLKTHYSYPYLLSLQPSLDLCQCI